jgi:hypothetical protein
VASDIEKMNLLAPLQLHNHTMLFKTQKSLIFHIFRIYNMSLFIFNGVKTELFQTALKIMIKLLLTFMFLVLLCSAASLPEGE